MLNEGAETKSLVNEMYKKRSEEVAWEADESPADEYLTVNGDGGSEGEGGAEGSGEKPAGGGDVVIIPVVHGTDWSVAKSICNTGFASLSLL